MRIVALLVIVALAGCLGGDSTDDPIIDGGANGSTNPTFNITALNGSFAASALEGFAPLTVDFSWTASYILNGTEVFPDGRDEVSANAVNGSFSWSFDQDGDGTSEADGSIVPFNLSVLYATPGIHEATLMMEGQNLTLTKTLTILVTTYVEPVIPEIFEGTVQEPCPTCGLREDTSGFGGYSNSISHLTDDPGLDGVWSELPSDLAGSTFVATTTAGSVGLSFQATCNGDEIEAFTADKTVVGTVPDGAGCVWMWEDSYVRGAKLSFIAKGDLTMLPDDGLCWADDGILIGPHEAGSYYLTETSWLYEEGNGIVGLQWSEDQGHKAGCTGGDIVII